MKTLSLAALVLSLATAGAAHAATIYTTDGATLQGASGSLTFESIDADTTKVVWSLDTTGFNDGEAVSTNHEDLTHIAFKVGGVTSVSLVDPTLGTVNFPSNVSNGGCSGSSPASFVCLTLDNPIDATVNQLIEVEFLVEGNLDLNGEVAFRGKYGPGNGWVISETATPGRGEEPIPEPSAALVFAAGLLIAGSRMRARTR